MANSHDNFYTFLALNFVLILFVTVIVTLSGFSPFSYSFSLNSTNANTTTKNIDSSTISLNKTALSLIPLMIAEMKNTNVTNIPIEKVINATPSDVTALQNAAKNNVINKLGKFATQNNLNNSSNAGNSTNNIQNNPGLNNNTLVNNGLPKINNFASPSPANKTALLPFVVNLTKNTNATNIPIEKVINATPSDVTALQNAAKNNVINKLNNITSNALSLANSQNRINNTGNSTNNIQNNSGSNNNTLVNNGLPKINNFASPSPANKTALLPFVVNLTKNTNVTNIAIGKTINATPSDVTALQNAAKNNVINKLNNINNSLAR